MAENNNLLVSDYPRNIINHRKSSVSIARNGHIFKVLALLDENLSRSNALHITFLKGQQQAMRVFSPNNEAEKIRYQLRDSQQPVFSKDQLHEFGTGSIAKCFGPDFSALDQRKSPRIPNGDLLMIDRIISITGKRKILKPPASVASEYDVPDDAWYLSENDYPGVPLSVLLEIALQPCGILSAYLGTSLVLPVENNIFRNLDGEIHFYECPSLSGKTITNHVALLDSFSSGGMHIQNYAFELSADTSVFLAGKSSFGYFTQIAMEQQKGLDQGRAPGRPANNAKSINKGSVILKTENIAGNNSKPSKHLNLVDTVRFSEHSGDYHTGLISGEKQLGGNEWFYKNHFFQDPVMPGSLGLEAVMQGLWAYIKHHKYDAGFANPILDFLSPAPFIWKYRGQVIPVNQWIKYQIHLKKVHVQNTSVVVSADADFSVDGTRIYAFENINFTLREGQL
jgi:3-hydroxymyristoyl/3-hydroxydecanoyl-(acyl carrier protein) dehydratase